MSIFVIFDVYIMETILRLVLQSYIQQSLIFLTSASHFAERLYKTVVVTA